MDQRGAPVAKRLGAKLGRRNIARRDPRARRNPFGPEVDADDVCATRQQAADERAPDKSSCSSDYNGHICLS
jgi:hypothetical protein